MANDYVDEVLKNVRVLVNDNGLNVIGIPGIEEGFSKEVSYCCTDSAK